MDYKDENTWLMHGDCLERMKEIPDGSVDMVLCVTCLVSGYKSICNNTVKLKYGCRFNS